MLGIRVRAQGGEKRKRRSGAACTAWLPRPPRSRESRRAWRACRRGRRGHSAAGPPAVGRVNYRQTGVRAGRGSGASPTKRHHVARVHPGAACRGHLHSLPALKQHAQPGDGCSPDQGFPLKLRSPPAACVSMFKACGPPHQVHPLEHPPKDHVPPVEPAGTGLDAGGAGKVGSAGCTQRAYVQASHRATPPMAARSALRALQRDARVPEPKPGPALTRACRRK